MDSVQLLAGIYTNVFPVILPEEKVTVMVIERSKASDLRPMNEEIARAGAQVQIYAHKDRVFGYGRDAVDFLSTKGFQETHVRLFEHYALGAHLVIDGIVSLALGRGFWLRKNFSPLGVIGRTEIFRSQPTGIVAQGSVKIFAGYDLRCAYHVAVESLGLIVDVIWAYQDRDGNPLSTREMAKRNAMTEALCIQEELLRGTCRVNSQISKIRLHQQILPFVQEFQSVPLPCGGEAHIESVPFQVIL